MGCTGGVRGESGIQVLGGGAWRYCVDERMGCCRRPRGKTSCEVKGVGVGREPLRVTWEFLESPLPRRLCVGFTELPDDK